MRKPTNKPYNQFYEYIIKMRTDGIVLLDISSVFYSFGFIISLLSFRSRFKDSDEYKLRRALHQLKNRKHIPKTSPTHYIESGCAWAATKRT